MYTENKNSYSDFFKSAEDLINTTSHVSGDLERSKLNCSDTPGMISQRYEVLITEPIAEKSNEISDVFAVLDHENAENSPNLYAVVFKKNQPFRLTEIVYLKNYISPNFITPLEYGITRLENDEEHFVVILTKPSGRSFQELLSKGLRVDENFIIKKFLEPMADVFSTLHQNGIIHGRINPNNLYIDNNGNVTIDECISDLCGMHQYPVYEPIERAQCSMFSKGSGASSTDYYALGVTIYALISGKQPVNYTESLYIKERLEIGTYNFLNNIHIVTGVIADLIRGLTFDDEKLRWGAQELESIIHGRSYSLSNLIDKSFLSRAIIFNGNEHYSKKALAHDLSMNWDLAKEFIKLEKIKKWLDTSISEEKIMEVLENVHISLITNKNPLLKVFSQDDERLIKTLIVLDPYGPIRIKGISFFKDGIGPLLNHSIIKGHAETTKFTVNFIFSGMSGLYEIISAILGDNYFIYYTIYLMKIGDILKRKEFGFGLERILHELNPNLPCQSPLLMKKVAFGSHDVLSILENHNYNFDEISSKKNIIGYLAYKIGFSTDMKIRNLDSHTIIQKSRPYIFLLMMHLAQKNAKIPKLPRLCDITKNAIKDVLEMFLKSATIKKYFSDKLEISAKTGSFYELMNAASNPDYLARDAAGYVLALRRSAEISKEIFSFTSMTFITRELRNKSLNYAIKISYSIAFLVIIFILSKG